MPYLIHPQAATPPDETVIWRYMDFAKFLNMLEQRALYFSLLSELGDKWEAVIDRRMTRSIASTFAPSVSGNVISTFQQFNKTLAVNCWYSGREESVAMWALYTNTIYGVAIKSSIRRLKIAIESSKQNVFLGSVEYRDHDEEPHVLYNLNELTPLKAILQKRLCYKHECELRAFTTIAPSLPENPEPGQIFVHPFPETGILIASDLEQLIESVILGPHFPSWALPVLRSALSRAGINPPMLESDAFKNPPSTFIGD